MTQTPDASSPPGMTPPDMTPPGMTPPTAQGEVVLTHETTWPKVIGIISIIFGSLGIVNYGCNSFGSPLAMWMVRKFMPPGSPGSEQIEAAMEYFWWGFWVNLYGFLLAVLLLAAGIAITRRRRWSVKGHLAFSGLKVFHAIGSAVVTHLTMQVQFASAQDDPNLPPGMGRFFLIFGGAMAVLTFLFLLGYPVFLVYWMSRRKIREETSGWA